MKQLGVLPHVGCKSARLAGGNSSVLLRRSRLKGLAIVPHIGCKSARFASINISIALWRIKWKELAVVPSVGCEMCDLQTKTTQSSSEGAS